MERMFVIDPAIDVLLAVHSELIDRDPRIAPYMPANPQKFAAKMKGLPKYLSTHPGLLDRLRTFDQEQDSPVSMLVLPNYPLVLARFRSIETALVPSLGCTIQAMKELCFDIPKNGTALFSSDNSLIQCARSKGLIGRVFTFEDTTMKPEDYIALPAQGVFYNELYFDTIANLLGQTGP